jgi:plasmid segregation protein ParM
MILGIDIGYAFTKAYTSGASTRFASIVGTPEKARFGLSSNGRIALKKESGDVLVGEQAVLQSRFVQRREDRSWIGSDEYVALLHGALSEMSQDRRVECRVVTGLPLAYYGSDKAELRDLLLADHRFHREGHSPQVIFIPSCRVIPQPHGSLFAAAFDDEGNVADAGLLQGLVGVIDCGGHTTNILATSAVDEVPRMSASVPSGAWDVVRSVREYLSAVCPDLELRDHEIVHAIEKKTARYYGQDVPLTGIVGQASGELAQQVIATASQLWDRGAGLESILITGGGANLISRDLKLHFAKHGDVRMLEQPQMANAIGYFRFGQFLERNGQW